LTSETADDLVARLDSFDASERRHALQRLAASARSTRPVPGREVNLHCHTFFSYNAYGYSPSRFAWEASQRGLEVAGIVDFDVMDGVVEFHEAGRLLGLKTVAGLETRVFIAQYHDRITNSPHEPGISYLPVAGLTQPPSPGTDADRVLRSMAERARRRNIRMAERVNAFLDPVTIDYEADVLPLTPAGNATERHMLVAYERRAREVMPDPGDLAAFWSEKLREPLEQVRAVLDDPVALKELMRARLMKYGGVGYAAPQKANFPALDEVVRMTLDCGGVPTIGWLDGTNDGEKDPEELFRFLMGKGLPMLTVVPDRNWNLRDPAEKAAKVDHLHEAMAVADRLELPVIVGTEMNKHGQKFVDTFDAPELAPYRDVFLNGARIAWGHTLLRMTAGVGFAGAWVERWFGGDAARRNAFFCAVGALPYPGGEQCDRLARAGQDASPETLCGVLGL
jgi:hypothetical protein